MNISKRWGWIRLRPTKIQKLHYKTFSQENFKSCLIFFRTLFVFMMNVIILYISEHFDGQSSKSVKGLGGSKTRRVLIFLVYFFNRGFCTPLYHEEQNELSVLGSPMLYSELFDTSFKTKQKWLCAVHEWKDLFLTNSWLSTGSPEFFVPKFVWFYKGHLKTPSFY